MPNLELVEVEQQMVRVVVILDIAEEVEDTDLEGTAAAVVVTNLLEATINLWWPIALLCFWKYCRSCLLKPRRI